MTMYPKGFLRDTNPPTDASLDLLGLVLSKRVIDSRRLGEVIKNYCIYMEREDEEAMYAQAEAMGLDLYGDIHSARAILLSRGPKIEWTTERPTEPGNYWFAGWREKCNAAYGAAPAVYLCHAFENKNGEVIITGGGTVLRTLRNDDDYGALGVWALAQVPELPADILNDLKGKLS